MFLSIAFCVLFSQLLSVFWNNKQLFANEHKKHLLSSKAKKRKKKWRNCWKRLCIVSLQETNEFFYNVRYSNGKQNCLIFTAFMSFGRQTNREFLTFFNTTNTVFLVLISCIWAEQKVSAAAAAEATAVESR